MGLINGVKGVLQSGRNNKKNKHEIERSSNSTISSTNINHKKDTNTTSSERHNDTQSVTSAPCTTTTTTSTATKTTRTAKREAKNVSRHQEEIASLKRDMDMIKSQLDVTKRHLKETVSTKQELANECFVLRSQVDDFASTLSLVKELRWEKEQLEQKHAQDAVEYMNQLDTISSILKEKDVEHERQLRVKDDKIHSLEKEIKDQNRCISFLQLKLRKYKNESSSNSNLGGDTGSINRNSSLFHDDDTNSRKSTESDDACNGSIQGLLQEQNRLYKNNSFRDVIRSYRNIDDSLVADMKDATSPSNNSGNNADDSLKRNGKRTTLRKKMSKRGSGRMMMGNDEDTGSVAEASLMSTEIKEDEVTDDGLEGIPQFLDDTESEGGSKKVPKRRGKSRKRTPATGNFAYVDEIDFKNNNNNTTTHRRRDSDDDSSTTRQTSRTSSDSTTGSYTGSSSGTSRPSMQSGNSLRSGFVRRVETEGYKGRATRPADASWDTLRQVQSMRLPKR